MRSEEELSRGDDNLISLVNSDATLMASSLSKCLAAEFRTEIAWAAYSPLAGFPVGDWIAIHGRFPPCGAMEIARQIATALAALESANIEHGNLNAASVWLTEYGDARLTWYGLKPACASHQCAFVKSTNDIQAFGRLCWKMLTGREPLAGKTILDVQSIAPGTPMKLADLIRRCIRPDSGELPRSFAEIVESLGPPVPADRRQLVATILHSGRTNLTTTWSWEIRRAAEQISKPAFAIAACILVLAASTYPLWKQRPQSRTTAAPQAARFLLPPLPKTTTAATESAVINGNGHPPTQSDVAVRTASFQSAAGSSPQHRTATSMAEPEDIIELIGGTETMASALQLQPHCCVRPKVGERACVRVPAAGLIVAVDGVRFENIDFIWKQQSEQIVSPDRHTIVDLRAARVKFEGCTFFAAQSGEFELPAAVHIGQSHWARTLQAASHVEFDRCVFRFVSAAVDVSTGGPIAIAAKNTLLLPAGPVIRFLEPRRADAPASINFENATVRDASAVVELKISNSGESPAPITITANSSVLLPSVHGALVLLRGGREQTTTELPIKAIEWTGQSSLIGPDTRVVVWQQDDSNQQVIDEGISVDGLVTSTLEFEGDATCEPASSRLKHWLGPIRSDEPPGIGENLLQIPN